MAALVSCPKHNMVACLEKTERNAQFHEIFWNTATSKIVNDVSYIKAKVAGKTVSISEASIRRDLLFHDVDGIDCLTNQEIYENLQLMGTEDLPPVTESSYRPNTTQDPRVNLEGTGGSQGICTIHPNDSPLSGGHTSDRVEGGLNLDELLVLYTNLLSRAKKLGKKESVSKQRRKNAKPGPTLDDFDDLDADLAHGMDYIETEEAVKEGRQSNESEELNLDADTEVIAGQRKPEVHTTNAPVSTADPEVSAVEPRTPPPTTNVEDSSRPMRSITTLKPLPSIDLKDKENGILVEEEPFKMKRKDQGIDQIERDEELAHKLHEEGLAEIVRIQEEKAAQEEASRVAIMEMFDELQAGTNANALFAAKLQQEEREECIIKERAKFLAETIAAQRKFRAAQRAAEIRSRPPTKSQLRNLMMTYLKNMGGYKHSQLKAKTFEKIQAIKMIVKKAAGADTSKTRRSTKNWKQMKRMSKRKKTESDLEEEEDLKTFLKIVPDKEGMIDYEVLEKRFPIINWEAKFYHYDY
ncbi:hypothetical protein Tco_0919724 [Tanacetum coccineum]